MPPRKRRRCDPIVIGCGDFAARTAPGSPETAPILILVVFLGANQDFPFAGVVGLADDAFLLQFLRETLDAREAAPPERPS